MHIGIAGLQRGIRHPEPLLTLVQAADRLGYDSVWFNEQHFTVGLHSTPSALLLAAAALARTTGIRVGLSVIVLPSYHPVLLAELLAQLLELGGGRVDLGIGRGASPGLSRAFPDEERRAAFFQAHDLLLKAWTSSTVSADGPVWHFRDVPVTLHPRRLPPLLIAGTSRETIAFAIAHRYRLLLSLEPPERGQLTLYDALRRTIVEPGPRRLSFSRYVCIGRTPSEARDLAGRLWQGVQESRRTLAKARGQPFVGRPFHEFCAEQVLVGDGAGCRAALERMVTELQLDHLRCVFNGNGALSAEETLDQMERFAAEVLHHPASQPWRTAPVA
ncbi:MAG: hypothetical protein KatS3mg060_2861 [Dehalococcoidia bacterium]|jgi:alkanesulfonate monooxygenase SsuD/methylene tetrahydromethanopterin reductase-like flavin-dependent oxidoreductase (luciferase family)|nr:MAG: hypothetical protein KatS3mg060_2861 [Dehalococcoidia bacterium]